jgi:RimJ/RimL family protein N-acetyltransferase
MTQIKTHAIETRRLILRTMREDDLHDLLQIFTDENVMAAFATPPFDETQMQSWMKPNMAHQQTHGFGLYSVIYKANGEMIGDCGLEMMEDANGEQVAELGYDFLSSYWGQGLATEAATAVKDYAFSELGMNRLISMIRQTNLASARVAEKVGMKQIEELERYGRRYWKYGISR